MTALTLQAIAAERLAEIGIEANMPQRRERARSTQWASELPGFGVRTYASGRKVYVVQTRMAGRLRTVTLCNVRLLSWTKARDVARRILLRVQDGQSPADERARIRKIPTYDRFLQTYWERVAPTWKASTLVSQDHYRRRYLNRAFGRRTVDKITRAEVAAWFADVGERGGHGAANRSLEILRAAFYKAEEWGMREPCTNPASGIARYPQMRFARHLREEELAKLGAALNREKTAYPLHVAALQLLLLTGCRRGEITGLLWSEVVGSRLKLTDSKTGPRTVWLGPAAQAILKTLRREGGQAYVFWDEERGRGLFLGGFWAAFCKRSGFEGLRIHDLRHSFASHAAGMSETLPMIGQLLGHRSIKSTGRYAHLDDRDLHETNEKIGGWIHTLCGAGDASAPPFSASQEARYVR